MESNASSHRYAGFWVRLGALFVDFLIFLPLLLLLMPVIKGSMLSATLFVVLSPFVPLAYAIWMTSRDGQTVGKKLLKIRVLALDGSAAGFRRSVSRNTPTLVFALATALLAIFAVVSGSLTGWDQLEPAMRTELLQGKQYLAGRAFDGLLAFWYLASAVALLADARKRALHDRIGGTVVVHDMVDPEQVIPWTDPRR
jgi:uncharacterized RDD family membrane protein YckC